MTKRLEEALKRLTPELEEQLASIAERLARGQSAGPASPFLTLGWAGKGAHLYPEHKSGVEASHAAGKMWRDATERGLSK